MRRTLRSKRIMLPVAVALVAAILVTLLPAVSGERVEPTATAQPESTPSQPDSIPVRPTASATQTAIPEPTATPAHTANQCLRPDPLVKPANNRPLIEAASGELVTLDANSLFDLPGKAVSHSWVQVFAEQDSLDYTTYTTVRISNSTSTTPSFRPSTPGKYRFRLTSADAVGSETANEVEVLVPAPEDRFEFRSINFPDLFGENGGEAFRVNPEDPNCRAQVFDHAFSMAPRVNANWLTIVPAQFLTQVDPSPIWGETVETLSLTNDEYYAALIESAHSHGLKVLQAEQDAPGFSLDLDQERWAEARRTPEYWEGFFDEWTPWAVERAARAEKYGVDMFSPFVWANDLLRPEKYPDYERRWLEMIAAIREVFSGQIAIWSIGSVDQNLTFLDELDAVILSLDSNGLFGEGFIDVRNNPQLDQVISSVKNRLDQSRPTLADSGVPIIYSPIATSSDGQLGSEDPEELATFVPDFQEQAIYYEGMLQAFASEPWITGIMLSVTDWFDQFARPPEGLYFDQTFQASPRSKPAEDVSALWFGAN